MFISQRLVLPLPLVFRPVPDRAVAGRLTGYLSLRLNLSHTIDLSLGILLNMIFPDESYSSANF